MDLGINCEFVEIVVKMSIEKICIFTFYSDIIFDNFIIFNVPKNIIADDYTNLDKKIV